MGLDRAQGGTSQAHHYGQEARCRQKARIHRLIGERDAGLQRSRVTAVAEGCAREGRVLSCLWRMPRGQLSSRKDRLLVNLDQSFGPG